VRAHQRALDVDGDGVVDGLLVMSCHDICSLAMSPRLLTATSSRPKRSHTASAIRLTVPVDDVGLHKERLAARGLDARGRPPRASRRAAVMHGDVGALLCRAHRDLGTETGARPGDQDALSGKALGALGRRHDVRCPYLDEGAAAVGVQDVTRHERRLRRAEKEDGAG
jgi:hypothetical protein